MEGVVRPLGPFVKLSHTHEPSCCVSQVFQRRLEEEEEEEAQAAGELDEIEYEADSGSDAATDDEEAYKPV